MNIAYEKDPRFINEKISINPIYNERLKPWPPTCYSNSIICFCCPPPSHITSTETDIDLEIKIECEITSNTYPGCSFIPNIVEGALYYIIDNVQLNINNCSKVTKYHELVDKLNKIYKIKNNFIKVRFIENPINDDVITKELTSKIVLTLREPLKLFESNKVLSGLSTMDLLINLVPDQRKNKIFLNGNIKNVKYTIKETKLYTRYLMPSLFNKEAKVSYVKSEEYTPYKMVLNPEKFTKGKKEIFMSNSYQLANIPKKVILYAKDLDRDKYIPIKNLSINRNNNCGILSENGQYDLFLISKRSGLRDSWEDFQDGSVIVLETRDLFLTGPESKYKTSFNMFQFNVTLKNNTKKEIKNIELGALMIYDLYFRTDKLSTVSNLEIFEDKK